MKTIYRRDIKRGNSATTVDVRKDESGRFHVREVYKYDGESFDRRDGRVNPPNHVVSVTSIGDFDNEDHAVREADDWYMANVM